MSTWYAIVQYTEMYVCHWHCQVPRPNIPSTFLAYIATFLMYLAPFSLLKVLDPNLRTSPAFMLRIRPWSQILTIHLKYQVSASYSASFLWKEKYYRVLQSIAEYHIRVLYKYCLSCFSKRKSSDC